MGGRMLVYFYRRRLRLHAVQELLAGVGVAVAVALVFAVLIANRSIGSSAGEVVHALIGPASLQLRARDADGPANHHELGCGCPDGGDDAAGTAVLCWYEPRCLDRGGHNLARGRPWRSYQFRVESSAD